MVKVTFRFYSDLNDLLLREQRNTPIGLEVDDAAAVKHPIESLGVPHTEVEAILANRQAVDFSYRVQDCDTIEVYPQNTADLPPNYLPLRPSLPLPVRFVADTHLGRLATYLRMLGFDTLYRNDYDDHQLADIAAAEERVLLTRDRGLLKHKIVVYGYCLRTVNPRQQLVEILRRYHLGRQVQPWRRCIHCNGLLHAVDKSLILEELQPKTRLYYDKFQQCGICSRIYWQGSHFDRMAEFVEAVLSEVQ